MVERTKMQQFEEFEGKVKDIKIEPSKLKNQEELEQYHIYIEPLNVKIEGKTGLIHEWIRISEKATDNSVPEGSVLDRYLQQIEILHGEAKAKPSHVEVFQLLLGNSYKFKKVKLGKSFEKHEAKEYWTPIVKL